LSEEEFATAGMLILKHDTQSATLTGRWMPPMRSLDLGALSQEGLFEA
jgi:hypothetical protein